MKILVLMGQRKCTYKGEYAPEALACISEFGDSEVPEYMEDEYQKAVNSREFDSVKVIPLEVDDQAITNALFPVVNTIKASVASGN